jgi:hypothetical protein
MFAVQKLINNSNPYVNKTAINRAAGHKNQEQDNESHEAIGER